MHRDIPVEEAKVGIVAAPESALFHIEVHHVDRVGGDHADGIRKGCAAVPHIAHEAVGGGDATRKGGAVEHLGNTVLNDHGEGIVHTAEEAVGGFLTRRAHGIGDEGDTFGGLALRDQGKEGMGQVTAVCDQFNVHAVKKEGGFKHPRDTEAPAPRNGRGTGIEVGHMPESHIKGRADGIEIGIRMGNAEGDAVFACESGKCLRALDLGGNAPALDASRGVCVNASVLCGIERADVLTLLCACLHGGDVRPLDVQTEEGHADARIKHCRLVGVDRAEKGCGIGGKQGRHDGGGAVPKVRLGDLTVGIGIVVHIIRAAAPMLVDIDEAGGNVETCGIGDAVIA